MKKIIIILIAIGAFMHYKKIDFPTNFGVEESEIEYSEPSGDSRYSSPAPVSASSTQYSCDGRQHCSQMHSCDEATYFLNNCPNTKMDGDHDGIPCERQWC